jgi:hypothetical protein
MFQTHQQNLDQIEATRRKLELPLALHDEPMGKLTKRIKRHEANIRQVNRRVALFERERAKGRKIPQVLFEVQDCIEYNQACITFIRFLQEV